MVSILGSSAARSWVRVGPDLGHREGWCGSSLEGAFWAAEAGGVVAVVSAAHRAVHSHRIGPCLHCPFTHDKGPETEELGFKFCLIYLSGHG